VFDLTVAVEAGLLMACGFFIWRMSQLFRAEPMDGEALRRATGAEPAAVDGVHVLQLYGPLFFGAVGKIEALPERLPAGTRVLVLQMHRLISLDTTGIDALTQLLRALRKRGIALVLAEVNEQPRSLMRRSGFEPQLDDGAVAPTLAEALARAADRARAAA
jgi:SulP family sulfate permease